LETRQAFGIAGEVARQKFQGHIALEFGIARSKNHTHPALAEV